MNHNKLSPDFRKAYVTANDILLSSRTISSIPVDVVAHIRYETDIKLMSYKTAISKYGFNPITFGSDDAMLIEGLGRYILFYKREGISENRMRWSLAHEIGHFYLNHDLSNNIRQTKLYSIHELEANFFAAQLLMPDQLLWNLIQKGISINRSFLTTTFAVSDAAAQKRLDTLYRQHEYKDVYVKTDEYELINTKYEDFLNQFALNERLFFWDDALDSQNMRDSWLYN